MWTRKISNAYIKSSTKYKWHKKYIFSDTYVIMITDKDIKFMGKKLKMEIKL